MGRLTNHRNIVDVHTSGFTEDELPFIVMEYIDGGTLKDRIGTLDETDLLRIADQLCDGLQAAHNAGVLHRDLKPENIFLRQNGEVVVGDFGIARLSELGVTASGAIPATIAYAAPETLAGDAPTPATDVYGIGISIITAKLGRNPFRVDDNDSIPALLNRVLSEPIPDLTNHFSTPVATCLTRATLKDPTQRISSADQLQNTLRSSVAEVSTKDVHPHNQLTQPVQGHSSQLPTVNFAGSPGSNVHHIAPQPPLPAAPTPFRPIPPTNPKPKPWLYIGTVLAIVMLMIAGALFTINQLSGDSTASTATQPVPSEPTTAESTTTSSTSPELPLFLPLGVEQYVTATGLPRDITALIPNNGPANNTIFCDRHPTIDGLEETLAEIYEPNGGIQGVAALRVMRFADADAASSHVASYVETSSCGEWLEVISDGGPSTIQASQTEPPQRFGDETVQIDSETTLPTGIKLFARGVSIRRGRDVVRINYTSLNEEDTYASTNTLTVLAIEALEG